MCLSSISNLLPASLLAKWISFEKVGPLISRLNPLSLYPFLWVRRSVHVSMRPYSHLSGLVEEPNMTIHDLASRGQPCLLKQSAVITNMKDG